MLHHGYKTAVTLIFVLVLVLAVPILTAMAQEPQSQEQQPPKIPWQVGPTMGQLGDIAQINIPKGFRFTGKAGTQQLLVLTHNIPSGKELGAVVADDRTSSWFMIFEFEDSGYVKDDEKDKLDANALLTSLKEGTEQGNDERKRRGWRPLHVTGWDRAPYYDPATHNLTWATRVRGDEANDQGSVNHSIRLLGRRGTINVDLVADPGEYAASLPAFNTLISGFAYKQGNRYSDFTAGDKVAEYGLAALIAGGAGAVALKTGLLAKLWKFIVVGIAAIAGFIKKVFRAIFGKEEKVEDPSGKAAAQG
jgi:uncharacterized membrane-anchored protein